MDEGDKCMDNCMKECMREPELKIETYEEED